MILKLSIIGLFIVLIVVLTVSYYSQLEGFNNIDACAGVTDATVISKVPLMCLQQIWLSNNCTLQDTTGAHITDLQQVLTKVDFDKSFGNFGMLKALIGDIVKAPTHRSGAIQCLGPNQPATPVTPSTPATHLATPVTPSTPATPIHPDHPVTPSTPATHPVPSSSSDLSKGSSLVPPSGAGPAHVATLDHAVSNAGGATHSAATPNRTDIQPHVAISSTGHDAMTLHEKSDLLSNIQKIFRNELLASRSMDASTIDPASSACSTSDSIEQGNEYMNHKGLADCS